MNRYFLFLISSLLIYLQLISCDSKKSTTEKVIPPSKPTVIAPEFNADSAFRFVETQVNFGKRVPNSKPHVECVNFITSTLGSLNWEVTEQTFDIEAFDKTVLNARNIFAAFNPSAKKRVILAAHWDTRPFADQAEEDRFRPIEGANDGASGVAVLLELARVINQSEQKPSIGIDLAFFDVEDYGAPEDQENQTDREITYCLGSQYWAENPHIEGYHAYYGILLDMVGAKGATFTMEGISMKYAPQVVKKVWSAAAEIGYGQYFIPRPTAPITDDHYIVNTETSIQMIDIIHYDEVNDHPFFEHWHTHDDTIEVIDKNTLKAVGQTLLHVLYNDLI